MSSWTDEEAAELQRKGNDYARRTWLKNAPPIGQGGRPKEGDPVDVFKRFVVDVYERKRYYWEDDGNVSAASAPPAMANHVPRVATGATTVRRAPVRKAAPPPAPPPAAPVADLLDFTSMASALPQSGGSNGVANTFEANFDAFAPAASVQAPAPSAGAKTATAASNNDPFQSSTTQTTAMSSGSSSAFKADFDAFAPKAAVPSSGPPASVNKTVTPIKNDPFQPTIAPTPTTTTSTGSSFSFINNNNVNATPPPAPTPTKKPVMNNSTMSQKSSLISSMSMPAPSNIQQGRNAMGTGMSWNNNNNSNAFGGLGNMQSMQQQTMMMQQQQMNMMNGMSSPMNNNMMGAGMMNNNPMMMMGNNNNNMMMMMGNNNAMMMNQQQTMMNGNGFGGGMMSNNANGKSKGTMQSLQMNSASMSAWSGGFK